MNEQDIDLPCPVCGGVGQVKMITHIDEIPYFGEHTQVTLMCDACSWRQTDFIPAEGKKAGAWALLIDHPEKLTSRVVRASSCTVRIPELDLAVNPGSNATGYVSNVEGVLKRFLDIINMVQRDLMAADEAEDANTQQQLAQLINMSAILTQLNEPDAAPVTVELLDPHGHSMIIHEDATQRDLTEEELRELPVGPDPAVFSSEDLEPSA